MIANLTYIRCWSFGRRSRRWRCGDYWSLRWLKVEQDKKRRTGVNENIRLLGNISYHSHTGSGLTFCVGDLEGVFVGGDVGGIGLLVGA